MHPQSTIEIPLSRGLVAIIDADDADLVLPYKWSALKVYRCPGLFYAFRNTRKDDGSYTTILLHRHLMNPPSGKLVDHIDGDGLNNRRSNMRIATKAENMASRRAGKMANNTTGYTGVVKGTNRSTRWYARIGEDSRIGSFETAEEAALAYDEECRRRYGDFCKPNFP